MAVPYTGANADKAEATSIPAADILAISVAVNSVSPGFL